MEQTDELFGEISCDEIQSMMDQILGQNTFSFSGYIDQILQGNLPFSVQDTLQTILRGFAANIAQEKKMYMYLVLIALLGAILGNFAGLMQGGTSRGSRILCGISALFFCAFNCIYKHSTDRSGDIGKFV